MNNIVLYTILVLCTTGVVAAVILYFVSKRFAVTEDERIALVEEVLPNSNCGGCGQPGCHAFAEAVVKSGDLSTLHCPVGGNDVMKKVADVLGVKPVEKDPYIAVVRCSGSFEYRRKTNIYDGASSCTLSASLYAGDTGCAWGCLGLGECVDACDFEAMYMDERTGLPVVIEDKCTACNACVKACPKHILELWPKGKKNQRVYVACLNEEKGSTARKSCEVACSGCAKCFDACRYEAISIEDNLASIDYEKCKLCMECIEVCDVHNILAVNVPSEKIAAANEQRIKRAERKKKQEEQLQKDASDAKSVQ
jgi:electron transport complex, RnfABCDGE type, B subunit